LNHSFAFWWFYWLGRWRWRGFACATIGFFSFLATPLFYAETGVIRRARGLTYVLRLQVGLLRIPLAIGHRPEHLLATAPLNT
jgi:hypothetical protein